MKITVVGLNHKTASIKVREKLALNREQTVDALNKLKGQFPETEFVLLSTCNRTELYYSARGHVRPSPVGLTGFFSNFCGVSLSDFSQSIYIHNGREAVRHLLKVASSLDSLVLGEPQILAQVKESYSLASSLRTTGKVTNRLFHFAFSTSKEVYSSTTIAQRRVSVASVAVELAQQLFEKISRARVAVIGAGDMGELLIRHLLDNDCRDIVVFNRTFRRAEQLARKYDIHADKWEELPSRVAQIDIIVAAAMTEDYLFDKSFCAGRRRGPLLVIDIAVPRNFDPAVNDLDDVYLYSIDDLAHIVEGNIDARQEDITRAEEIIEDNIANFMDWLGIMDIGPQIGRLRQKFQQIGREELDHFFAGETDMSVLQKQKMETVVNRVVNRLLHRLINNFHTLARQHGATEVNHLVRSLIEYQDRTACPAKEDDRPQ